MPSLCFRPGMFPRRHSGRSNVGPRRDLPPFSVGHAGVVLSQRQRAGRRSGGTGAVTGEARNLEKKARGCIQVSLKPVCLCVKTGYNKTFGDKSQ